MGIPLGRRGFGKVMDSVEKTKITGTLLWYWAICPREAWLMAHDILPDEDDPYLELGRFLSTKSYPRLKRRELCLPGMKVDLVQFKDKQLIVVEVKKSSRFLEATQLQLLFYLARLEELGVHARGEIRVPTERRRLSLALDEMGKHRLLSAITGLSRLLEQPNPPPPTRISFCRRCAYRAFCWAEEILDGTG